MLWFHGANFQEGKLQVLGAEDPAFNTVCGAHHKRGPTTQGISKTEPLRQDQAREGMATETTEAAEAVSTSFSYLALR